jgi:hypothetical protein
MTTYTATVTSHGETNTFISFTAAQVKAARKAHGTKNVKAVKNEAPKFWYYRGEMVALIEDVTNGWTLVCSPDGSRQFRAVTAELEYR